MISRCLKILLLITSLVFTTGFIPIVAIVGPATTIITSGNIYKASAQLIIDQSIKKKTGKNSLTLVKEEMKKSNDKKNFNEDLMKLVEKRIAMTHKELIKQNNQNNQKKFNEELKKLIEKRIVIVQKKLALNKITQ